MGTEKVFGGRLRAGLALVVVAGLLTLPRVGHAGDDVEALRMQLDEIQQRLDKLEAEPTDGGEKLEAGIREESEIVGGEDLFGGPGIYENGFYIRSADENFSVYINALLQARYTFTAPEDGEDRNNFDLALGRIAFSGNVFSKDVYYFLQYEATTFPNNNTVHMLDWLLRYSITEDLNVQAGRFILPYSRQFYTHPGELLFPDLSEADYTFNLQRAVGGQAAGKLGPLTGYLAVTNSIRALDAGGQQNWGKEVAVLGRAELDILAPYGYLAADPKLADEPQLSVGLAAAYNPIDEKSGFQNVVPGMRTTNLTLDTGFRYGPVTIQAAGYYRYDSAGGAQLAEGLSNENSSNWGYYIEGAYLIIPETLQIAARFGGTDLERQYNIDSAADDAKEYQIGVNYYIYGNNLKVQADYSYLDYDYFHGGSEGVNRLRLQAQLMF